MWKNLKDKYFLFFTDELEVFVTDYVTIWCAYFTNKSFLAILKDSNPGLEMDEKELIDLGRSMFTKPEELKRIQIAEEDKSLRVVLSKIVECGLPLRLQLQLSEGSKELFFNKVTRQLLQVIHDLKCSENELRRQLLKKDEDIEWEEEKILPYDDVKHMDKHKVYSSHFPNADVVDVLLQKTVDIPDLKRIEVKQEECDVVSNGSTVKTEIEDSAPSSVKPEINIKSETDGVKLETNDEVAIVKEENVKTEPSSSQSRPMVSPHKRKRHKLNFL